MTVISFASPKGGVGKTTSLLIVASAIIAKGGTVHIIDADANAPVVWWEKDGGQNNNLSISQNVNENSLVDEIEYYAKGVDFLLVDLEGTANLKLSYAASLSDLVIVPCQRSKLDARYAMIAYQRIMETADKIGRKIPTSLLITRTNAAIRTKTLKNMKSSLARNKINAFDVEVYEREAFKAIFDHAKLLHELPDDITGKSKAIDNAMALLYEALGKINESREDKQYG